MPAARTTSKPAQSKTKTSERPTATRVEPPTDAERKAGILARRKVRATGHVIERIDGNVHKLGDEGGRWIVRVLDTGKTTRHTSYSEMVKAGRKA